MADIPLCFSFACCLLHFEVDGGSRRCVCFVRFQLQPPPRRCLLALCLGYRETLILGLLRFESFAVSLAVALWFLVAASLGTDASLANYAESTSLLRQTVTFREKAISNLRELFFLRRLLGVCKRFGGWRRWGEGRGRDAGRSSLRAGS